MQARDVMTREVVTVGPNTSAKYAGEVMAARGFAALPVVDDESRLVGIVAEADVLRDRIPTDPRLHARRDQAVPAPPSLLVHGVMTSPVRTVDVTDDEWRRVFALNCDGVFYFNREAARVMVPRGAGRIVNVASIAGKEGNPMAAAYSASKAAVIAMTKSIGKDLATTGVLVNCVAPAVIATPMLAQMSSEHVDYMVSKIPMARVGQPEEVAELIAFLASERMTFSTGATFDISGGRATF